MLKRIRRAPDRPKDPDALQRLAVAILLVEVARADFHIDPSERDEIRGVLASAYGIDPVRAAELVAGAERAAEEAVSLYDFTRRLNDELTPREKTTIIEMLWRIAFADGRIDKYEEHVVRRAADLLNVPHRRFIRAKLAAEEDSRRGLEPAGRATR